MSKNPIQRLQTSSFAHLRQLEFIYLNEMPNLVVVEKYAFVNLPKLRVLEMKNNPRLIHFGTKAFGHTVINLQERFQNFELKIFFRRNSETCDKNFLLTLRFSKGTLFGK